MAHVWGFQEIMTKETWLLVYLQFGLLKEHILHVMRQGVSPRKNWFHLPSHIKSTSFSISDKNSVVTYSCVTSILSYKCYITSTTSSSIVNTPLSEYTPIDYHQPEGPGGTFKKQQTMIELAQSTLSHPGCQSHVCGANGLVCSQRAGTALESPTLRSHQNCHLR